MRIKIFCLIFLSILFGQSYASCITASQEANFSYGVVIAKVDEGYEPNLTNMSITPKSIGNDTPFGNAQQIQYDDSFGFMSGHWETTKWGRGENLIDKDGNKIAGLLLWRDWGSNNANVIINNGQRLNLQLACINMDFSYYDYGESSLFKIKDVELISSTGNGEVAQPGASWQVALEYIDNDAIAINNNAKYVLLATGVYAYNSSDNSYTPITAIADPTPINNITNYFMAQKPMTATVGHVGSNNVFIPDGEPQAYLNLADAMKVMPVLKVQDIGIELPSGYSLQKAEGLSDVQDVTNYDVPVDSSKKWAIGGEIISPNNMVAGTVIITNESADSLDHQETISNSNITLNWNVNSGFKFSPILIKKENSSLQNPGYDVHIDIDNIANTNDKVKTVKLNFLSEEGVKLPIVVDPIFGMDISAYTSEGYTIPESEYGWGVGGDFAILGDDIGTIVLASSNWQNGIIEAQQNNKVPVGGEWLDNLIVSYTLADNFDYNFTAVNDEDGVLLINVQMTSQESFGLDTVKNLTLNFTENGPICIQSINLKNASIVGTPTYVTSTDGNHTKCIQSVSLNVTNVGQPWSVSGNVDINTNVILYVPNSSMVDYGNLVSFDYSPFGSDMTKSFEISSTDLAASNKTSQRLQFDQIELYYNPIELIYGEEVHSFLRDMNLYYQYNAKFNWVIDELLENGALSISLKEISKSPVS
ncbi:hypothetical protein [Francisella sciaenopsi]|uniref:Uncharacterized protein n=1 Tax=Francisella sciaenopsi TaxID=3055034 RepID=A0ABQ6PHL4_9GAMM